jgi:hypothetical protein
LSATSDLSVVVNAPAGQAPTIVAGFSNASTFDLRFTAEAGIAYRVEYRDSLTEGTWLTLSNVPAPNTTGPVEVTDPIPTTPTGRYYRVVLQ